MWWTFYFMEKYIALYFTIGRYQNIDTAARTYNTTLAHIIDNLAPNKSRIGTVRDNFGVNMNGNTSSQN